MRRKRQKTQKTQTTQHKQTNKLANKKYLSKGQAASYLGVPAYVLTTLARIGRMNPDKGRWFWKKYSVWKLDQYRVEARVDTWNHNERILKMLRDQKTV